MNPPRLRHLCIVVPALAPALDALRQACRLEAVYRDPAVERWGVENAMLPVGGSSYLELRAPIRADAPAHRFLARRPRGGGYILALGCTDLDARRTHLQRHGVRLVNELALPGFRSLHVHPRDSGACMLELNESADANAYAPAGDATSTGTPAWRGFEHIEVRAFAPQRLAAHWAQLLQLATPASPERADGAALAIGEVRIDFAPVRDGEGEGIAAVMLKPAEGALPELAARNVLTTSLGRSPSPL